MTRRHLDEDGSRWHCNEQIILELVLPSYVEILARGAIDLVPEHNGHMVVDKRRRCVQLQVLPLFYWLFPDLGSAHKVDPNQ